MRRSRMFALPGVLALAAATALSATASATPAKSASSFKTSTSAVSAAESASGYIVLAKEGLRLRPSRTDSPLLGPRCPRSTPTSA